MLKIPVPKTMRQVRKFLGSAGFCRLWVPGYTEIARPLYKTTKAKKLTWNSERQMAFETIKQRPLEALP